MPPRPPPPKRNISRRWANLDQARVNLERTQIRSPVNGFVTNLLAQLGDYASAGQNEISLIDGDSFWVDGYFEETSLHAIHEGDPASMKLMGYRGILSGHVAKHCARHPGGQRAARSCRSGHGQSDFHLGASGATDSGAHRHRSGAERGALGGRHDGHSAGRSETRNVPAVRSVEKGQGFALDPLPGAPDPRSLVPRRSQYHPAIFSGLAVPRNEWGLGPTGPVTRIRAAYDGSRAGALAFLEPSITTNWQNTR